MRQGDRKRERAKESPCVCVHFGLAIIITLAAMMPAIFHSMCACVCVCVGGPFPHMKMTISIATTQRPGAGCCYGYFRIPPATLAILIMFT